MRLKTSWKFDAISSFLWLVASLAHVYVVFLHIVIRGDVNLLTAVCAFFALLGFTAFVLNGLSAIKKYKEKKGKQIV